MKGKAISTALVVILTVVLAAVVLANGVVNSPSTAGKGPAVTTHNWTTCELLTMAVGEAWQRSGHNYVIFTDMIEELVGISADKRGVDLPNRKAAGEEIGKTIRQQAESDPDQLLYTVVDAAMRKYATRHPESVESGMQ